MSAPISVPPPGEAAASGERSDGAAATVATETISPATMSVSKDAVGSSSTISSVRRADSIASAIAPERTSRRTPSSSADIAVTFAVSVTFPFPFADDAGVYGGFIAAHAATAPAARATISSSSAAARSASRARSASSPGGERATTTVVSARATAPPPPGTSA